MPHFAAARMKENETKKRRFRPKTGDPAYPPTRFRTLSDAPDREIHRRRKKSPREEATGSQAGGSDRDCPTPPAARSAIRRDRSAAARGHPLAQKARASSMPAGRGAQANTISGGKCADHRPGCERGNKDGRGSPRDRTGPFPRYSFASLRCAGSGGGRAARRKPCPQPGRGARMAAGRGRARDGHLAPACAAASGRGYRRGGGNP